MAPLRPLPKRLIFISIDGLRPEFYLDSRYPTPHLQRLARQGLAARRSTPIYPSVTYPNHASYLTGTYSARHGILSNSIFSWEDCKRERWYFDHSHFKCPTLWDLAREAGLKTCSLRWPTSAGAPVDYLVPESFSLTPGRPQLDWMLTIQASHPAPYIESLLRQCGREAPDGHSGYDQWMTDALIFTLQKHQPDLSFLHLIQLDHVQHSAGREAPEVDQALRQTDNRIGELLEAIDLKTDCVIFAGDHGFSDFTARVNLNTLFHEQGWITLKEGKLEDWEVIAHNSCGQAAVYTKRPWLTGQILEILEAHSHGVYQILSAPKLSGLEAFPEAICAVDAAEGFSMGDGFTGELVTSIDQTRGEHGYLAQNQNLQGGFVAAGVGIPLKKIIDSMELIDIAPTLAELMHLPMPTAQGKSLFKAWEISGTTDTWAQPGLTQHPDGPETRDPAHPYTLHNG
ncbi:MAG: alkaline phosphatase family protein [Methylotenera sp.]|nr:alkaline phosphatase family protein [Oligoflexia bacterium]